MKDIKHQPNVNTPGFHSVPLSPSLFTLFSPFSCTVAILNKQPKKDHFLFRYPVYYIAKPMDEIFNCFRTLTHHRLEYMLKRHVLHGNDYLLLSTTKQELLPKLMAHMSLILDNEFLSLSP